MHRFVEKYSSSPFQMPLESGAVDMCGKWDAAQDLAFPTFDIPDVHNVIYATQPICNSNLYSPHLIYSSYSLSTFWEVSPMKTRLTTRSRFNTVLQLWLSSSRVVLLLLSILELPWATILVGCNIKTILNDKLTCTFHSRFSNCQEGDWNQSLFARYNGWWCCRLSILGTWIGPSLSSLWASQQGTYLCCSSIQIAW